MKNNDTKIVLKLLDKYAESYNILKEENKILTREIQDLKVNLKINKEIIQGFLQLNNQEDITSFYLKKIKEESKSLNEQIEILTREKEELKAKLLNLEQLTNATITLEKEENNLLSSKLFVVENIIMKKDSIIDGLNKKISKLSKNSNFSNPKDLSNNEVDKEVVLIVEPSVAVNQIHDELQMYKKIYQNLSINLKELKMSLHKFKKINQILEVENSKLKNEMKSQTTVTIRHDGTPKTILNLNINKKQDDHIKHLNTDNTDYKRKKKRDTSNSPGFYKGNKSENNIKIEQNDGGSVLNMKILKQYENFGEINRTSIGKSNNTDEWYDTLKHCGMTQEEFVKLSKNKVMIKLVDALEYLYKLILDKNIQINLLLTENEDLNLKNFDLNKENISLYEKYSNLIREIENRANGKFEYSTKRHPYIPKGDTGMDSSMINNTSRAKVDLDNRHQLLKNSALNSKKMINTKIKLKNFNENHITTVTNTIESINSSDFRDSNIGNNSFFSNTNNENNVPNIIIVEQIKNTSIL